MRKAIQQEGPGGRQPPRWLSRGAGVAGALVLLLAGCGGKEEQQPKPVSTPKAAVPKGGGFKPGSVAFGVLAPLSGPDAARGRDLVDGAKLAMTDLNIRGGVGGQRVKLVTYDDKCDPASARASARALKSADVAGAVGGICDRAASAAARTLGAKLPFLVTSANAPSIVSAKKTPKAYLFNGTPYQSALATVHWLSYARAQRLAVVTADDKASRYLGEQVLGLASPVPKPVSQQAVDAISDTVVKAALTGDPDTVYFAGPAAMSGELVTALRAAGYQGGYVASAESESPEFLAVDAAEGAYVIAPASPQNLPEAAEWAARFKEKFGREPGFDALQAYDGVRALAHAVTQSGKVDAERNSAELAVLDEDYETFLDRGLAFASDHTIKYDNNIVLTVSGGAFRVENTLRSER